MSLKVLVAEPLADEGVEKLQAELDVDVRLDLDPRALLDVIGDYDAVVVRSSTKITRDVIEAGSRLKVVGRAGIGLDNIDVDAATRLGVMVANAPGTNSLSTAEHAMALLLSQARNIPQAASALKAGRWEKSRWEGIELQGKTLGILGLGRIGKRNVLPDRPEIRGMIAKVPHLIEVSETDEAATPARRSTRGSTGDVQDRSTS